MNREDFIKNTADHPAMEDFKSSFKKSKGTMIKNAPTFNNKSLDAFYKDISKDKDYEDLKDFNTKRIIESKRRDILGESMDLGSPTIDYFLWMKKNNKGKLEDGFFNVKKSFIFDETISIDEIKFHMIQLTEEVMDVNYNSTFALFMEINNKLIVIPIINPTDPYSILLTTYTYVYDMETRHLNYYKYNITNIKKDYTLSMESNIKEQQMLINPYETKVGLHINTKNLEVLLSEYLIKGQNTNNLNYEYVMDTDIDLVFITGKNQEEQELPVWNHPLFINDFRGKNKIFVDVRPYVKIIKDEEVVNLNNIVTNKLGFNFAVTRVIYMVLLFADKSSITNIKDNLAIAFSKWISSSIKSSLHIDIEAQLRLEIITMHYILCLLNDEEVNDRNVENIYFKISKLIKVLKGNIKYVKETCEKINVYPKDVVDLAENIKIGVKSPLLQNITSGIIYNITASTWNGINPNENIAMCFEHLPTLIAVLSSSLDNKALKHSRLSNILNDNKRAIGCDDLIKYINLTIKDQVV